MENSPKRYMENSDYICGGKNDKLSTVIVAARYAGGKRTLFRRFFVFEAILAGIIGLNMVEYKRNNQRRYLK